MERNLETNLKCKLKIGPNSRHEKLEKQAIFMAIASFLCFYNVQFVVVVSKIHHAMPYKFHSFLQQIKWLENKVSF